MISELLPQSMLLIFMVVVRVHVAGLIADVRPRSIISETILQIMEERNANMVALTSRSRLKRWRLLVGLVYVAYVEFLHLLS